jgi:hypothetical protein
MERPRIGLILLRAEWFDSVVALPELVEAVQADASEMLDRLGERFDVAANWVVNSAGSLTACQQAVQAAEVDLFVLAFQVWAEDFYVLPLGGPSAAGPWPCGATCPAATAAPGLVRRLLRGSGPVGTFEGLGTLRNLGVDFFFTQGSPSDLCCATLRPPPAPPVRRMLRAARFGLLPGRNEQMQSTFVDEFRLLADFGPTIVPLSPRAGAQSRSRPDRMDAYLTIFAGNTQCSVSSSLAMSAALPWHGGWRSITTWI